MEKWAVGLCRTLCIILPINYQDLDTFNKEFLELLDFKRDQNKFRRGSIETSTGQCYELTI
jgi:hypothetical protein